MNPSSNRRILFYVATIFCSIIACQSATDPNSNSLPESANSNDDLVQTAVQALRITDTHTAEIASQQQTEEAILTEAVSVTETPAFTATPDLFPILAEFPCVPTSTQKDLAQVVQIIDGDTIEVIVNGSTQRVRYIGVDTPKSGDPFFQEAKIANAELVEGKTITLVKDVSEVDQYNRLLRYVFVGENVFVNYKLVEEGYAQILTYPPDVACSNSFLDAQRVAEKSSIGIWGYTSEPTNTPKPTAQPAATSAPAAVCSCSGNLYNCADFSSHNAAQSCYSYCISQGRGDIHRLDSDSDGITCESLP